MVLKVPKAYCCTNKSNLREKKGCSSKNIFYQVQHPSQKSPSLAVLPKQARILRPRVPRGQSSLMQAAELNTTNPLIYLPEAYVAISIPHKDYPIVYRKQSGYKQSPPQNPSTSSSSSSNRKTINMNISTSIKTKINMHSNKCFNTKINMSFNINTNITIYTNTNNNNTKTNSKHNKKNIPSPNLLIYREDYGLYRSLLSSALGLYLFDSLRNLVVRLNKQGNIL